MQLTLFVAVAVDGFDHGHSQWWPKIFDQVPETFDQVPETFDQMTVVFD